MTNLAPAEPMYFEKYLLLDLLLTMYRTEELQTSFKVGQRPSESLDEDCLSGTEETDEWFDSTSEL